MRELIFDKTTTTTTLNKSVMCLCSENGILCMNILAFLAKRSMYSFREENDRAAGICRGLVKQNHDRGSRLLYVVIVSCPTQIAETMSVHDSKILPLLPRTIGQVMMLRRRPCTMQPISADPVGFPAIHIPLPKNRIETE